MQIQRISPQQKTDPPESIKRLGGKQVDEGKKAEPGAVFVADDSKEEEARKVEEAKILKILGDEFTNLYKTLDEVDKKEILEVVKLLIGNIPEDINDPKFVEDMDLKRLLITKGLESRIKTAPLIKKLIDYIGPRKVPFADKMSELVEKFPFVLVGEMHTDSRYMLPDRMSAVLPRLQQETKARGEELILCVEVDASYQGMIDSLDDTTRFREEYLKRYPGYEKLVDPVIEDGEITEREFIFLIDNSSIHIPKSAIKGFDESEEGEVKRKTEMLGKIPEIIFQARKDRIRVVAVDYWLSWHVDELGDEKIDPGAHKQITPLQAQRRDSKMFENISKLVSPKTKIVFYGGYAHTSEEPRDMEEWGVIETVGTKLSKKYGPDNVISIRSVDRSNSFDDDAVEKSMEVLGSAQVPRASTIMAKLKETTLILVPSGGPIKTTNGHYDFVVVDPTR